MLKWMVALWIVVLCVCCCKLDDDPKLIVITSEGSGSSSTFGPGVSSSFTLDSTTYNLSPADTQILLELYVLFAYSFQK